MTYVSIPQFMITATGLLSGLLIASPSLAENLELRRVELTGQVATAHQFAGSLSMLNLAIGAVTTLQLPVAPHKVDVSPEGGWLPAVGEPTDEGHDGHEASHDDEEDAGDVPGVLIILSTEDASAGPLAEIPLGSHPAHVVTDVQGRRAFVTNAGDNTVSVGNLTSYKGVGSIPTGAYLHGLRVDPRGAEIYVANEGFEDEPSNLASVIDAATNNVVATITVGDGPRGVSSSDEAVFVTNIRDDSLSIIDLATQTVTATLPIGDGPNRIVYIPEASD